MQKNVQLKIGEKVLESKIEDLGIVLQMLKPSTE